MGGKASKIAAAGSAARKYPTAPRAPSDFPTSSTPGPSTKPPPYAAFEKSDKIRQDAEDPDLASMLKTLGAVKVQDAAKNIDLSQVKNPQLQTLRFRQSIATAQEEEISDPEKRGRRSWVDVGTIHEILRLRDSQRWQPEKIEKHLGLAPGVVKRMGQHVRNP